jgi:hypothetical protein
MTKHDKTIEDFRVVGLEEVQPAYAKFDGGMYAGMLPSDNGDRIGETMFWLFEPETQSVPDTIVLWLNGGPGCSSFNCGVMMENSPVTQPLHDAGFCCLKPTPELSYNEHAWTRATTMLYVEHPIGTGFSYGSPHPETEMEASKDLHAFLLNFFDVFDHLKSYDFFVMGESYAGMFIPSITRYIHMQNLVRPDHQLIPIKGAAIGNGWMDAKIQGKAVIDYSWWHGLIDEPTRDSLHVAFENCLQGDVEYPPFHPLTVQDDCGLMWGVLQAAGNPNAYDITTCKSVQMMCSGKRSFTRPTQSHISSLLVSSRLFLVCIYFFFYIAAAGDPNVDQITWTSEAFYNNVRGNVCGYEIGDCVNIAIEIYGKRKWVSTNLA